MYHETDLDFSLGFFVLLFFVLLFLPLEEGTQIHTYELWTFAFSVFLFPPEILLLC